MRLRVLISTFTTIMLVLIAAGNTIGQTQAESERMPRAGHLCRIISKYSYKDVTPLKSTNSGATGMAKRYSRKDGSATTNRFQVLAAGLAAETNYLLVVNGSPVKSMLSDHNGSLEFSFSARSKAGVTAKPMPTPLSDLRAISSIVIQDEAGNVVLNGNFNSTSPLDGIGPKLTIADITAETNKTVTVQLMADDPNVNDIITFKVSCNKGNFISINGVILTVAPKDADVGTTNCTLTATDQANLSTSANFNVTVTSSNRPPAFNAVPDQMVRIGDVKRFTVQANDPNGDQLRLTVVSSVKAVRSIANAGGNSFLIELAPTAASDGGKVTLMVTDPTNLTATVSFNIMVEQFVNITAATRVMPLFTLKGTGFGASGATVQVNGVDVTARIKAQTNTSITLKGPNKKLGLRSGNNQIVVTVNGISSAPFFFSL